MRKQSLFVSAPSFVRALLLSTVVGSQVSCKASEQDLDDDGNAEGAGSAGTASGSGTPSTSAGAGDGGDEGGGFDDGVDDGASSAGGTSSAGDHAEATGGDEPPPEDEAGESTGADEHGTTGEPACNEDMPVTLYLSPDDSNSMSSPVQAREAVLSAWSSLATVPIRTWEFLNYYTFPYPAASEAALSITPELYQGNDAATGEYVLQIGVRAASISNAERPPITLTLVLDTSGSMSGHPMEMLKESCKALAASLKTGDAISLVTWNTENRTLLAGYEVQGPNDATLIGKIDALQASGGTDLHGGLAEGYAIARAAFDAGRINRLVLISDGGANVGITDVDLISAEAGGENEDGVYMVGVGVGTADTYNDELMDHVTDAGKGASVFIADAEEAWKVFNQDFISTVAVAARDVRVRVELPPGFEIVKFSGEEYSSDPTEVEPQHLAPNDAIVFHQEIATCAPDLVTDETQIVITAQYKDAVTFESKEVSRTVTFGQLLALQAPLLHKGAAVYEYAEALKRYRDSSGEAREAARQSALAVLARAEALLSDDPELAEIRSVLEALAP